MKLRCLVVWLMLLTLVLILLWAMRVPMLRAMVRWLDVGERPEKADYVMVLTGDEETRPFTAAALLKAGLARKVLVTEAAATPLVTDHILPPSHEICRQALLKRGIAPNDIVVFPAAAAATYDEAIALADFLRNRPAIRVIVVTSDYHTRRSRWVFARTLAGRAKQISFVSALTDEFTMESWWQAEAGCVAIVAEYLKLAFYVFRYGHAGYWLAACGGLALVARWIRRRETASNRSTWPAPAMTD